MAPIGDQAFGFSTSSISDPKKLVKRKLTFTIKKIIVPIRYLKMSEITFEVLKTKISRAKTLNPKSKVKI